MSEYARSNASETPPGEKAEPLHAGYFAPPPPEIADIMRAWTTLGPYQEPKPLETRLSLCGLGAAIGLVIGLVIIHFMDVRNPFFLFLWAGGLPLIGAGIAWYATSFAHSCGYVGSEGAARYQCRGRRDNISSQEIFFYRQASELRNGMTRRYTNGVYQGTDYNFTWTDARGYTVFTVSGTYQSEKAPPAATSEYHFGEACELGWSIFLLKNVVPEVLKRDGWYQFNLDGSNHVRVAPGAIEFRMKGQTTTCRTEDLDLDKLAIANGTVTFQRKDARVGWFSSDGVFAFPYANLANAHLFLFLLKSLVLGVSEPEGA
jgi:hypothetical protein